MVYDVTVASSLDKAKSWVKELQRQSNPNIVIALVGNKVDLVQPASASASAADGDDEDTSVNASADDEADDATATPDTPDHAVDAGKRQVSKDEAAAYALENSLLFFETSAKTGENVVEVFTDIGPSRPSDSRLIVGS